MKPDPPDASAELRRRAAIHSAVTGASMEDSLLLMVRAFPGLVDGPPSERVLSAGPKHGRGELSLIEGGKMSQRFEYPPWMKYPMSRSDGKPAPIGERVPTLIHAFKAGLNGGAGFIPQGMPRLEDLPREAREPAWWSGVGDPGYSFWNVAHSMGLLPPMVLDERGRNVTRVAEAGTPPPAANGGGALLEVHKLAALEIKANPKLDEVEARNVVFSRRQDLYEAYRAETTRTRGD